MRVTYVREGRVRVGMSRELYAAVRSQTYKALLLLVSSCGFTTTTRSGVALVKQLLLWLGLSALTGGKPLPPVEPVTHTYLDAYRAALRVHRWNNQTRAPAVSDLFKVFVSVSEDYCVVSSVENG